MSVRYRDAGVSLDRSDRLADRLRARLGTGLFGSFLPVPALKMFEEPVLVSSIDGVGTKVHLATSLGRVEGLGQDLVHHCVNDIAVHGATPLLFLDYLAFHRLDPAVAGALVGDVADACAALGMVLAGGETAEMPLVYPPKELDMAGAIVGVVERDQIVDGGAIRAGDVLLGLPSSGLHTNGYSLVQRLFTASEYARYLPALGCTLGEALLVPHSCYLTEIRHLLATGTVHGLAHITGGGIPGNLARIIPDGLEAVVELPPLPPLFRLLQAAGVPPEEMRTVFNLGVGMIAVCDPAIASRPPYPVIGTIQHATEGRRVRIHGSE